MRSRHLQLSLSFWLSIGLLVSVGGSALLAHLAGVSLAVTIVGAFAWWIFVDLFLLLGIPMLVTPDGRRLDYLGTPNGLTAIRAWACLPVFLCAALTLPHNLGLILWCSVGGVVGMLDFFDGLIARSIGPITALGKAIDPAMDALFFSMAAVGSVLLNIMPVWLMVLILVRYLGPALGTPFVFVTGRRPELVHTVWGRRNTASIGVVFFVLMWVRIFSGPTSVIALAVGGPLLIPTTILFAIELIDRVKKAPRA